jgi:hypothetical protein
MVHKNRISTEFMKSKKKVFKDKTLSYDAGSCYKKKTKTYLFFKIVKD